MERRRPYCREDQNACRQHTTLVSLAAIAIGLLVSGTQFTGTLTDAVANSVDASPLDSFLPGEVTARQEKETILQINNKDYSVREDVLIRDDKMGPMTLKDLVPGTQVMFHLRQGRIDQIVILLPS